MRSKKAFVNIISSLILQIITIICGFIVPRLIIINFGSNVNGLITSITKFLAYITLLESGFGPVVKSILYKPIANKNKEEIEKILKATDKFFKIISYIFIIYIVILCVLLPIVTSNEFNYVYTLSLIVIIAISTFAEYYFGMTYKLYLQAEQKTYVTSIIQMGTTIINTIMIVLLIYWGASIQIVKLFSAIVFLARPILQNMYVKKKYNIHLKGVSSDYKIKQKWDGLAQHITAVIHDNTDVVVLTIFMGTKEVSVYSIYLLVINGIKSFVQALTDGVEASWGDMIAKEEKQSLNHSFKIYEIFYFIVTIIVFSSTMLLILSFVNVYATGITDTNYYRPSFAYIIVLAEFIWAIRKPYNDLVKSAGHFKQTVKGAWLEAGINVFLSIILVFYLGLTGVAIGTLVAMLIRTIEIIYYATKHILNRNIKITLKRVFVLAIEFTIAIMINVMIPDIVVVNYITWIIQAMIVFLVTSIAVIGIDCLVYKEDMKGLIQLIKKNILKKA